MSYILIVPVILTTDQNKVQRKKIQRSIKYKQREHVKVLCTKKSSKSQMQKHKMHSALVLGNGTFYPVEIYGEPDNEGNGRTVSNTT